LKEVFGGNMMVLKKWSQRESNKERVKDKEVFAREIMRQSRDRLKREQIFKNQEAESCA
jgi:hypothetical protein